MKARVPMLSKSDKEKITGEISHEIEKQWKEREEKMSVDLTRRILKTFLCVMHEKHGFGKKRLAALFEDFTAKLDESSEDIVFWEHIDRVVIDQLGIPFERDYTDRGRVV